MTTVIRDDLIQKILNERARQFNLPGREMDIDHMPNDWITIASAYLHDGATRNHVRPDIENYQDALVKAAAVILAALEHVDMMKKKARFQ